jgi:hypothetical protein
VEEAIALADEEIDQTGQSGLGARTRLHGEVQRVRVLAESQHSERALAEAATRRRRAEVVPDEQTGSEAARRWEVWEELHEAGQRAAIRTGHWEQALRYDAELHRTKQACGAPLPELAEARFPAYMPLARLGRTDEALGNVEHLRGHGDVAIARAWDSLPYAYQAHLTSSIVIGRSNLGTYLHEHARDGGQRRPTTWPVCSWDG